MRIVGGRFRGRVLKAPAGRQVRPTSDRAREGIFNILAHSLDWGGFEGRTVLDVFAGTGALGLEAMSRGAERGVFIDNDAAALKCLQQNAAMLGLARDITTLKLDAGRLAPPPRIANAPLGLVFLDPPYGTNLAEQALLGLRHQGWLAAGCVLVVEVGKDDEITPPREFSLMDERSYGAARVLFLRFRPS